MVTILYHDACADVATSIKSDLLTVFNNQIEIVNTEAAAATGDLDPICWDDLLLIIFNRELFPENGNAFVEKYMKARGDRASVLPVATCAGSTRPPGKAEAIKAILYEDSNRVRTRVINRIGAMLGLRWQGRESNLFISYRAKDGKDIAEQLYAHLVSLGHRPFLDEARECDDLPRILPGSLVQKEIDTALNAASMVLLIDTPSAPDSIWIRHEVETADSLLLPILPIVFRQSDDRKKGPRFPSLRSLMRWVDAPLKSTTGAAHTLGPEELDNIVYEAEWYYCDIFRRKCRVPYIVEKEFNLQGFTWTALNQKLFMFHSSKRRSERINTTVLTHCSIFDQIYGPAVRRFIHFREKTPAANHSLFIYDGELLPEPELVEIAKELIDPAVIILHHQELATLIQTNFTVLGATS